MEIKVIEVSLTDANVKEQGLGYAVRVNLAMVNPELVTTLRTIADNIESGDYEKLFKENSTMTYML